MIHTYADSGHAYQGHQIFLAIPKGRGEQAAQIVDLFAQGAGSEDVPSKDWKGDDSGDLLATACTYMGCRVMLHMSRGESPGEAKKILDGYLQYIWNRIASFRLASV